MKVLSMGEYLKQAGTVIREASEGNYTTVRMSNGAAAVIIDETEWTMLRQALAICTEHPEWTDETGA